MAVATLPIIGTPHLAFFRALDFLPLVALVAVLLLWQLYIYIYLMVTIAGLIVGRHDQGAQCLNYEPIKFVGNNA